MSKLVVAVEKLVDKELHNPVVLRTVHTAWQAALGAAVASLSGTHGDVRVALMVGVAAAAAAVKNAVFHDIAPVMPVAADPVVVSQPAPASPAPDAQPAPAVVEPPATAS